MSKFTSFFDNVFSDVFEQQTVTKTNSITIQIVDKHWLVNEFGQDTKIFSDWEKLAAYLKTRLAKL